MPLNIPMPADFGETLLKGVNTGSGFFARMMQSVIEREKQAQLERHFQEELKLRKAAAGRAGANSDLQRQMLQQQLLALQHKNDPNWELQNYLNTMKAFGNVGGGTTSPVTPVPEEAFGEGQGVFNPEGLQQAQAVPETAPGSSGGMNLDIFKQNPMLRGFFKHKYGVDPLAVAPQTPEEKNASALDLFNQKEALKAQQEQKMPAAIKTLHENIIHLSPKAVQAIQHLIDIPSPVEPWGTGFIKSGQKAAHNKAVTAAAENYSKAKGWPNTKGSIEKAESILQRGNFETDFDYRKRLKEYQQELKEGVKTSNEFMHPGKQIEGPKENIIEYVRVNGKLVPKGGS